MWNYIVRRTLYNIPVFLAIILVVMAALRVSDPVSAQLGKNASDEQVQLLKEEMGLDEPFIIQYFNFLGELATIWDSETRSWDQGLPVSEMIAEAIPPSMAVTIPTILFSALISVCVGLVSAFNRGRGLDRSLMFTAVIVAAVALDQIRHRRPR